MDKSTISIVTPTFRRPEEVKGLLKNISEQSILPIEIVLVDGAPTNENSTEKVVESIKAQLPFDVKYIRRNGGTAIQRNVGIDAARGQFVAFVDDDVRLERNFLKCILDAFAEDTKQQVGGIVGFRTNEYFDPNDSERWRWYKRLGLLSVFEPGQYDYKCGYPINNCIQPPFSGTRPVDFMTTACAVWRREIFDSGMRFDDFFRDYGMLEDAHFSLRASRKWTLLQAGDARCEEMRSPNGRMDRHKIGYKSVVNYYFVFREIAGPLSVSQKLRFWRFQGFEFFRIAASAVRRLNPNDLLDLGGRINGVFRVVLGIPNKQPHD